MNRLVVLVIDDDRAHAEATGEIVARLGHEVQLAYSGADGIAALDGADVVITDLVMRDRSGLDVIAAAQGKTEVIVVTGYGSEQAAPAVLRAGAAAYLVKPLGVEMFRRVLRRVARNRRRRPRTARPDSETCFQGMVAVSAAMQALFGVVRRVGDSNATVLIEGESGTGKELVARAVHGCSPRARAPFVAVNCAALSAGLLESELFGHEKGAFTGAQATRRGRFEAAQGGTLFLDEIGEMDPALQAKLLRALEEREIVRVGSNDPIEVDVRVVAATNRPLKQRIQEGSFRPDLYFRLNVVRIALPPLQERREDIPVIAETFLDELAAEHGRPRPVLSPEILQRLVVHPWPGNVRELRNCLETMLLTSEAERLLPAHLPAEWRGEPAGRAGGSLSMRTIADVERELIANTLDQMKGNRARAARALGISARTLYRRIKQLGLS